LELELDFVFLLALAESADLVAEGVGTIDPCFLLRRPRFRAPAKPFDLAL
jgi:hypothetical protein